MQSQKFFIFFFIFHPSSVASHIFKAWSNAKSKANKRTQMHNGKFDKSSDDEYKLLSVHFTYVTHNLANESF